MQNNNIIFNSIKAAEISTQNSISIPPGYIDIRLSTKGKLGAPELFHIRNFKVQEIYALSMTNDATLPARLVDILNNMILEEGVNVADFHEKEVEELMIYIFMNFFRPTIEDFEFPITEEDIHYMEDSPEYKNLVEDVKIGKWKPRTTLNFAQDLDTYDIPDDFNPNITIRDKKTDFYITFSYVKYGDRLVVKNWLDAFFAEDDARFKATAEKIRINEDIRSKAKLQPELLNNLIILTPQEEKDYADYLNRKSEYVTEIIRYVSVIDYNGTDVSNMSLSEKYQMLSADARIDYRIMMKLAKKEQAIHFGVKPEVHLLNPITKQPCLRRFSFRIPEIVQAMLLFGADDDDDEYDAEAQSNIL